MSDKISLIAALIMAPLLLTGVPSMAAELKDPTRPSGFMSGMADEMPAETGEDQLKLQAIFFNPNRSSVLINGRRFQVGDVVGDSRIEAIHVDRVELIGGMGRAELVMSLPEVKSRPGEEMPTRGSSK